MTASTNRLRMALDDLKRACLVASLPLDNLRILVVGTDVPPADLPIPPADAPSWQPMAVGSRWGAPDVTAWFAGSAQIPNDWLDLIGGVGVRRTPLLPADGVEASGRYAAV